VRNLNIKIIAQADAYGFLQGHSVFSRNSAGRQKHNQRTQPEHAKK
jgi:hypothetical protein